MDNSNYSQRGQMAGVDTPEREARPVSGLDLLSEMRDRIAALEARQDDLHAKVDRASERGDLDPEIQEHMAHVLRKHFFHDRPVAEPEAPRVPKFDPFTGQPLH